jgi:hypothetical protein
MRFTKIAFRFGAGFEGRTTVARSTGVVLLLKEEGGRSAPCDCSPSSNLLKEEENLRGAHFFFQLWS